MEHLINNNLIKWARERENLSMDSAAKKLGVKAHILSEWEKGSKSPTFKQIQKIAKKFYVPLGYLFLDKPPDEKLPIKDFRTINNQAILTPSPQLLEVLYDAKIKQSWLKEVREEENIKKILDKSQKTNPVLSINKLLDINGLRDKARNYEDFLKSIIEKLDKQGFVVIRNGVVGNNTYRQLNLEEFRGFALYDDYAPLIFINGKDAKSGQIFTIIHELAHLVLGEDGLDGAFNENIENRCNKIAAEVLVPERLLRQEHIKGNEKRIANQFKVSRFVILVKARQLNLIDQEYFTNRWQYFKDNNKSTVRRTGGGDFYKNVKFRAGGENFLNTVINYTLSGKILYRDAYELTGLKGKTFAQYLEKLVNI